MMESESGWKILWGYIWQYRKTVALFFCCMGIFVTVFLLYGLETEAVLYAAVLGLVIATLWGAVNFTRYRRRHRRLRELRQQPFLLPQLLPAPRNLREADYHALLQALYDEASRRLDECRRQQGQSWDYFTLWAHQIKTPIAAISLILQEQDSDASRELQSELLKIEQYVQMALCYLRLEEEQTDFVFRPCALQPLLRQAVRRWSAHFIRKKLWLRFEVADITVVTDQRWLLFVVEQLLSNALKYTFQGGVTLATEGLALLITDTGIGIAAEDLPRVCEQGFTGYNGRSDRKSTGIGLYLCQKLCRLLGHALTISSQLGVGTTVRLDLQRTEIRYE